MISIPHGMIWFIILGSLINLIGHTYTLKGEVEESKLAYGIISFVLNLILLILILFYSIPNPILYQFQRF